MLWWTVSIQRSLPGTPKARLVPAPGCQQCAHLVWGHEACSDCLWMELRGNVCFPGIFPHPKCFCWHFLCGVVHPCPSSWGWATSEGSLLSSHLVKKSLPSGKFYVQTRKKNADKLLEKQRHWNQLLLLQQSRKSQWEKTGSYGSPLRKMCGRLPFWWRIRGQTQQVAQNHQGVCGIQNWISYLM